MNHAEQETKPILGIAILQWNHVDHTTNLLMDLDQQLDASIKLVICDNGSELECWHGLQEQVANLAFKSVGENNDWQISLVRNRNNSGFARGMNVAIERLQQVGCEWVWVLNNDIRLQEDTLQQLTSALSTRSPGWYGTMIRQESADAKPGLIVYNKWMTSFQYAQTAEINRVLGAEDRYIDGASMLIHHTVLNTVGLLNEQTFLYFEELDYAKRVKAAGFNTGVVTEALVGHIGAGSSGSGGEGRAATTIYHETWSTLAFTRAHHPLLYIPTLLVRTPARILSLAAKLRFREIPGVVHATIDFLRGFNRDKRAVSISENQYFSRAMH